ncbi:hypothetical protein AVEN_29027-1 [Araneus ventricosus]|uniref:Uncharacterized protein n=1 Tax=Araneus ventricosus TaxID=182803 RepID=A0A4Y2AK39_ARAVE|nr:hypothetical protein AVEN_29027-1 [Araneus ventricosus]
MRTPAHGICTNGMVSAVPFLCRSSVRFCLYKLVFKGISSIEERPSALCYTQIAIFVCRKFAADLHCKSASLQQICHDKSAVKQVCSKLTQASKSPWDELVANLQQTCTANSLQIIARTEYEHNPG